MRARARQRPIPTRDNTCDLRGLRVDDAVAMATSFLDRALNEGQRSVFLLHGHGTGALREAVREELGEPGTCPVTRRVTPIKAGTGSPVVWLRMTRLGLTPVRRGPPARGPCARGWLLLQRRLDDLLHLTDEDEVESRLISSGTSSRSARLRSGTMTLLMPARCAARTFSFRPPMGSTRPRRVISPVIATSWRTRMPVRSETSALSIVTPALGPSFGIAARRDVDVNIGLVEEVLATPKRSAVRTHVAERRLRALLHHVA